MQTTTMSNSKTHSKKSPCLPRVAWILATFVGAALAPGCAYPSDLARSCAGFRANSGAAAFSIGTTDALDAAPLVRRLEPGQVVAIGEATHGTHEHRHFQALVMQSLVLDLGYTGVAIEGVGVEALWLNDYVCENKKPFSPIVFNTIEYYDAVEWLRVHNETRAPENCVKFIPLDPFDGGRTPIVYIMTMAEREGVDLNLSEKHVSCLREWIGPGAASFDPCRTTAAAALERALLDPRPELGDLRLAARFAQDAAIVAAAEPADPARDYFMATNIITALDEHPKGIVVWGHDGHVSEGPIEPHVNAGNGDNTMGSFLSRSLGARYVSVAQLSVAGTAVVERSTKDGTRDSTFETPPDFFERLVGEVDMGVDLRNLTPGNSAWRCAMSEHRMMWLGGKHAPSLTRAGQRIVPGADFDILVLMGKTTRAGPLELPLLDGAG